MHLEINPFVGLGLFIFPPLNRYIENLAADQAALRSEHDGVLKITHCIEFRSFVFLPLNLSCCNNPKRRSRYVQKNARINSCSQDGSLKFIIKIGTLPIWALYQWKR